MSIKDNLGGRSRGEMMITFLTTPYFTVTYKNTFLEVTE